MATIALRNLLWSTVTGSGVTHARTPSRKGSTNVADACPLVLCKRLAMDATKAGVPVDGGVDKVMRKRRTLDAVFSVGVRTC